MPAWSKSRLLRAISLRCTARCCSERDGRVVANFPKIAIPDSAAKDWMNDRRFISNILPASCYEIRNSDSRQGGSVHRPLDGSRNSFAPSVLRNLDTLRTWAQRQLGAQP